MTDTPPQDPTSTQAGLDPSAVSWAGETCERVLSEMGKRLVGQKDVATRLLMAIIAEGHVLLEGLPGLAKTTSIRTLAECAKLDFRRIQFTPDMLPADVMGTQIFDPKSGGFTVRQGPVFANLVLADEINRAPAKVQSALLEAMQERQVTIGDSSMPLPRPFLVLATQNPIEQEGTYPLPEAQVDRFLFKVKVDYGTLADELEIIHRAASGKEIPVDPVMSGEDVERLGAMALQIKVAPAVRDYIARLVVATREPKEQGLTDLAHMVEVGASPRASLALDRVARVQALMLGRDYVTPQDVKDVAPDILRHRLLPTYEAEAEGVLPEDLVTQLLAKVPVP